MSTPRPTPRVRDPYLDNVKLIGVVLVVVGHFWTALRAEPSVASAYLLLYLFHMPVFVLMAGMLSSTGRLTSRRLQRLAAGLVAPYLVFQALYELGEEWLGRNDGFDLLGPPWLMWFLAALICWRLMAPVITRTRGALPLAVAVSLAGGLTTADDLALAQVLGLLPFFVLGLQLRRSHLELLRSHAPRPLAVATFAVAGVACWYALPRIDMEWIYWRSSYSELGVSFLEGAAIRTGLLLAAVVLTAAFLVLVPGRRAWFTTLGPRTMYAYLLHGFVILALTGAGFFDLPALRSPVGGVFAAITATGLALWLMSDQVRRWAEPLVEPTLDRLWNRPSAQILQGVAHDVENAHVSAVDDSAAYPRDRVGAAVALHHPGVQMR